MRFGTYFFLQAPPGHRHADIIQRELDQMVLSETLGFDEVWLTEHHFIDYGLSVDPATLASALASRTSRVRIGLAAARHRAVAVAVGGEEARSASQGLVGHIQLVIIQGAVKGHNHGIHILGVDHFLRVCFGELLVNDLQPVSAQLVDQVGFADHVIAQGRLVPGKMITEHKT